jgi:small-conductance mechanosensitive channel
MQDQIKRWLLSPTLEKLIVALIGVGIVYFFSRLAQRSISTRVTDPDTRYRVRKFASFLGYLVALGVIAAAFSEHLSNLTVAFGFAGAGIAFALQDVIASVAGWLAVSFGALYSPGDRVQLGGIKGDVIDVSILRTTLMELGQWVNGDNYNGRIVRISNSFVLKEPVHNYSADFPFLWDEITLPIRYGSDWEYTRKVLEQVVNEICGGYVSASLAAWRNAVIKYRLEEARIEPTITLAINDNWIQFTARYIVDYRKRRFVKDRIFTRFLEEVDKSNRRIQLASTTFEVVNLPRLDIQFTAGKGTVDSEYVP